MERAGLREALRLRRSVDRFARGWYGGLLTALLAGLWLAWTTPARLRQPLWQSLGAGLLLAAAAVVGQFLGSRREASREAAMLARLAELDARGPRTPELF